LKYTDEQIELFSWCATAADASAESKQDVATSSAQIRKLETAVKDLTSQLEELVQARDEDETVLLQKFRDLLNEKKVKIREQQKVLASGSFNASFPRSSQPSQSPAPQPTRKPAKSRPAKRKQPAGAAVEESDEEDGVPQEMDVDDGQAAAEDADDGASTDRTASAMSDDDDEDDTEARAPPPPKKSTEPPPARRDLPFGKKKPTAKRAPAAPASAGSETQSDDEL
jgi:hypothetical protein